MIKIKHNKQIYDIDKNKILFVLSKLNQSENISDIIETMKRYKLFCEHFLKNVNKL